MKSPTGWAACDGLINHGVTRVRTVEDWLSEYGESHRHPANKAVHWVCVPAIMFSLLGLLWCVPLHPALPGANGAVLLLIAAGAWYLLLSARLALGILPVALLMLGIVSMLDEAGISVVLVSATVFVAAWAAQFWGHHVEGRRPSFFKDVQFLLVGPVWLLAHVYRRLGIPY